MVSPLVILVIWRPGVVEEEGLFGACKHMNTGLFRLKVTVHIQIFFGKNLEASRPVLMCSVTDKEQCFLLRPLTGNCFKRGQSETATLPYLHSSYSLSS